MPRVPRNAWAHVHLGALHSFNVPDTHDPTWMKIKGVMDSGAVAHAINRKHLPNGTLVKPTEMSTKGAYYTAANGTRVYNEGVARISGKVKSGQSIGLDWQVAAVEKPLISTHLITKAGNSITFNSSGGYIQNEQTNERIPFSKENGSYILDIWVKAGTHSKKPVHAVNNPIVPNICTPPVPASNRFAALEESPF